MSARIDGNASTGGAPGGGLAGGPGIGYLLVRGGGGLWAAAGEAVQTIERRADGVSLRLVGGGELEADEVLGVAPGLGVRTLGEVVRVCWGEPARGLSMYGGEPCVVIDPAHPPRALQPRRSTPPGRSETFLGGAE